VFDLTSMKNLHQHWNEIKSANPRRCYIN